MEKTDKPESSGCCDHRDIGMTQELFFFDKMSAGSPFYLPDGAIVYSRLMNVIKSEYKKRGFQEVMTPTIYNKNLWEASGHWDKYKDNMFLLENCSDNPDNLYAMKPMNCPAHCLLFKHRVRSYRELPVRFSEFGALHRNEPSHSGMYRTPRFVQDDAHIFCMNSQIKSEITSCLEFLDKIYSKLGFTYEINLSTRPEKYIGDIADWDDAEKQLEEVLNESKKKYEIQKGDGAFYGPKIDIQLMTPNNKKFQCATIQLDFQLPKRFELEYWDDNGRPREVVMIHRAIFGSFERFIAILCEGFNGNFPFWLSPKQIIVVPVSKKFMDYAFEVHKQISDNVNKILKYDDLCIDVDESSNTLSKKILDAQHAKYNYTIVVGAKELENKTLSVRYRDGKQQIMKLEDLYIEIQKQL